MNKNLETFFEYIKSEKKAFALGLLIVLINTLGNLLLPIGIQYIIENSIKNTNFGLLQNIAVAGFFIFLALAVFSRLQVIIIGFASQRITRKIKTNLVAKIQKLDVQYFTGNSSGDLISKITGDTQKVSNFFGEYIFQFTSSFFSFIALGIYLFTLQPILALVSCSSLIFVVLISRFLNPNIKKATIESLAESGKFKNFLGDNFNNYQIIEAYSLQDNMIEDFNQYNRVLEETTVKSRIYTTIFRALYNFASNLALLLVIITIFYLLNNSFSIASFISKPLTVSLIIAFIYATIRFFEPLRTLGSVFTTLQEALAAFVRIDEVMTTEIVSSFKKESKKELKEGLGEELVTKNAIEVKNLTFSYSNNDDKLICDNISFVVQSRTKVAIIGPTGQGKSTIAKLLSGLIIPNSGEIRIFDKDISDYSQEEFYNLVGFILQDPYLFSGTVASNISYGNSKYTDYNLQIEKLKTSLESIDLIQSQIDLLQSEFIKLLVADFKRLSIYELIDDIEEFLLVEVTNNSQNISLGQKQLISFIRVILREPQIIILDEATANLDTVTESKLQNILAGLNNKVTQIVIAHRQNTIEDADQILFMVAGKLTNKNFIEIN